MATKRPDGIYPYIGTDTWGERLADAVENTCEQAGVIPPPRSAITEGIATALGDTEIKKIVVTSRGKKVLTPSAWREVNSGDDKVLLLICDVHGAAVVPWDLNDRTVSSWAPPSPEATQRVVELVAAEADLENAEKAKKLAEKECDARRRAPGDDPHAAAALAAAQEKYVHASKRVREAERTKAALLSALGQRRPRPVVHAAEEDGEPKTALVLAEQQYEVAVHVHRYAVENLRRSGKTRGYDLAESLVTAGQLTRGMSVLQQWQVTNPDGSTSRLWRMVAVTANNRALARLDVFGLRSEHLVTGMPQSAVPLSKGPNDPTVLLLSQREILNRVSHGFNEDSAADATEPDHKALRAMKIATVPAEIVIGCSKPAALEHVLRALNVNDHLRGIQPYDEDARLIALFATLVDTYAKEGKLGPILADAFPTAQGADLLDLGGVRDALTANGSLDPLAPLLPADEKVSPVTLRDIAIRAITTLVFPDVPPAGPETGKRQVRDTGPYWPIVKAALQEAPWSQIRAKTAEARTRLWSAAIAQMFLHRANILSALGLFGVPEVKDGSGQDPRPLKELLLGAEAGDATAWAALVRRMAPALIHTPEPLITPGQGSEAGAGRKGVRRTPTNALAALTLAYTENAPGVSRELLLAFARSVLQHPDATQAPEAPGGGRLVCYGESLWSEEDQTPIVPGMVLAPDINGEATSFVADKAWFDHLFPAELGRASRTGASGSNAGDGGSDSESTNQSDGATTIHGQVPPSDPRDRLAELRRELPARIELAEGIYQRAVEAANALLVDFDEASRLRSQLGEEPLPADQRIQWMERLASARKTAQDSATVLSQVEALILQV
ncbi:hypothetical protein [Streptomyces collinus]|uniref:Uncharacterized protein n=1 Tax=Streptomyces collinus (strain DSM 40733 / Tue 365) TaxID=1214242 RepID=S5VP23_STRC3|nr:hypothetical protein [Streptomyces collinus]AGS72312.1 hypothetical protein B446_27520 [Streptomyces collinus Tu 365]UJA10968.1 hypothetical protein HGI10_49430 [Streptomyces collinus]UJA14168.1 hypothetical protein HGI09_14690 [Streptomyces collinus]